MNTLPRSLKVIELRSLSHRW